MMGQTYLTLRALVLAVLLGVPIIGNASTIDRVDSDPLLLQRLGSADFTFGIFGRIYSASLYAPAGLSKDELFNAGTPKRLELRYHRDVRKSHIIEAAERKIVEQRGEAELSRLKPVLDAWHGAMRDVSEDDRYLMSYARGELKLYLNDEPLLTLRAPALAEAYFDIWLGEDPISPAMRRSLLAGLMAEPRLASDNRAQRQ